MGGRRELSLKVLHRTHLQHEIRDEVRLAHLRHGANALEAAQAKLRRPDLTTWGRLVMRGAVRELSRERHSLTSFSYWRPPWQVAEGE